MLLRPHALASLLVLASLGMGRLAQGQSVVQDRIPGGVASGDGTVGYLAGRDHSVVAIDLRTGRELWTSAAADRPLAIVGDALAAWKGPRGQGASPRVVVLDAAHEGKVLHTSEPLKFPPWAVVGPDPCAPDEDRGDEALSLTPTVEGRTLVIHWRAATRYKGGAGPPRAIAQRSTRRAAGVVRVDLGTGTVEARETAPAAAEDEKAPESHPYRMAGAWKVDPFRVAGSGVSSTLALSEGGADCELVLNRRDVASGQARESVVLSRGPDAARDVSQVTPDGHYLLLHREYPRGEAAPGRIPWRVYSVPRGKLLTTLDYEPGASEVAVAGTTLLYRAPAAAGTPSLLRAVDLKTGGRLWSHPLPETRAPAASPARRP